MNTITIELCKEDRKRLDDLTGAVTLLTSVLGSFQPPEIRTEIIQEATGSDHPVDASTAPWEPADAPAPAAAAEPAPVEPTPEPVSFAEFQKAVTQAVAKGPKQKAAAREIINKYAASVSAVPEDRRAEVVAELAKI